RSACTARPPGRDFGRAFLAAPAARPAGRSRCPDAPLPARAITHLPVTLLQMSIVAPFRLRPMRLEDLDAVMVIEGNSFPTSWPRSGYEHELTRNEHAH